ncbi:hypothetical protein R54876_GBNLAHCA_00217 [Eupransor demetentiae]|uniref:Maturase K n=1 Tax=Eupransor demetentiae TaxID=3109584 RepID=A0ABM9N3E6_9LACO|nr:hypothetical protein R54876_GBNLAHCA_00217 [Lactobacillaceae bacterium LMG 33000]
MSGSNQSFTQLLCLLMAHDLYFDLEDVLSLSPQT